MPKTFKPARVAKLRKFLLYFKDKEQFIIYLHFLNILFTTKYVLIYRNPNKAEQDDPFWPSYKSRRAYIQLDDHVASRHDLLAQNLVVHLETIPQLMAEYMRVDQLFG